MNESDKAQSNEADPKVRICKACEKEVHVRDELTITGICEVEGVASIDDFKTRGVEWETSNSDKEKWICPGCGVANKIYATNSEPMGSDKLKEEDKWKCFVCGNTSFHLSGRVDGTRYDCTKCEHWFVIEDPTYEG